MEQAFLIALKQQAQKRVSGSGTVETLDFLRQARRKVADGWLAAGDEDVANHVAGALGWAHITLLSCNLKIEPLSEEERRFAVEASQPLGNGLGEPGSYRHLLASMLYLDGYETDIRLTHFRFPSWLRPYVIAFIFYRSRVVIGPDEMEHFNDLYREAWQALHATLLTHLKGESERREFTETDIVPYFRRVALSNAYFSDRSLREECVLRAELMEEANRICGRRIDYVFPPRPARRKIRLGVLRPHFNPGSETFATLPVFEYLDRDRFEIILYSESLHGSPLEGYCAGRADRLVDLSRHGVDVPARIRADTLDVLLVGTNISAKPHPNMISLHRLARNQIASFCEPATTGLRSMDYFLAGELALAPGAEDFYSERMLVMPGSGICFSYGNMPQPVAEVPRAHLGIPDDAVVYVSGANMVKYGAAMCHAWAEILSAVPGSVLVLYPFNPNWFQQYPMVAFKRELYGVFAQHGVATDRVILLDPRDDFAEIRGILRLADVYLDSFPYSGATSLADAMHAYLPVVALEGRYLRFRQAAAILRELGLHELVATDEEDYRGKAIQLGREAGLRAQLRTRIETRLKEGGHFLDSQAYGEKVGELFSALVSQVNECVR